MAMTYELYVAGKTFSGTLAEIYDQIGVEFLPDNRLHLHRRYVEENPGALESVDFVVGVASIIGHGSAHISGRRKVNR